MSNGKIESPTSNAVKVVQFLSDLKRRRERSGMSQTEVANLMDVTFQSVNRWENSSFMNATVSNVIAYLKVLESRGVDTSL